MKFQLYKVSGYEECIMAIRMSQGKFYSAEKAQQIQDLVYAMTNRQGFLASVYEYNCNLLSIGVAHSDGYGGIELNKGGHGKITGMYQTDRLEFKRLLTITMDSAMGKTDHHTLMKYIDISFFTDGLHRGAQDDLDAHAMGFNNRITRFSTRLAEISDSEVSEWYKGKVIPFHDAHLIIGNGVNPLPNEIEHDSNIFKWTPFGYMLEKYADMSEKNGLYKDVLRGLIPLGHPGAALWKSDMFNLRYIYFRRSKLTKANPELKIGMEQLADSIQSSIPVFGQHFRHTFTDTGKWEHQNRTRTVTAEEYAIIQKHNESLEK
jgi:hypothetical protein